MKDYGINLVIFSIIFHSLIKVRFETSAANCMHTRIAFRTPRSSRRQFIAGCSAFTLAAAAVPAVVLHAPFPRGNVSLETIGFHHFSAQLGTPFRVWHSSGQMIGMTLVEARPQTANLPQERWAPDALNEKFSLLFQGPADSPLEQDTYLFEHAALGRFPMFIVPVFAFSSQSAFYDAIFNRPFIQPSRRRL
jgi:hypothetical protein